MQFTGMEALLPTININLIDHATNQADKLARYWLSLDDSVKPSQESYSKIFWAGEHPIQFNIYNSTITGQIQIPECQAHVYLIGADSPPVDRLPNTYVCILSLDPDCARPAHIENLDYYQSSLTSTNLPTVLDEITRRAYRIARQTQDITLKESVRPIYPSQIICIEDNFVFVDETDKDIHCCRLL